MNLFETGTKIKWLSYEEDGFADSLSNFHILPYGLRIKHEKRNSVKLRWSEHGKNTGCQQLFYFFLFLNLIPINSNDAKNRKGGIVLKYLFHSRRGSCVSR